ncbi:hypothetical protein LBMAG42_19390 [Deltaproteobacteria bacterium]|nr:hypothetical protein LBMAG42_19390 [Deltaproteobacteria bacterium]
MITGALLLWLGFAHADEPVTRVVADPLPGTAPPETTPATSPPEAAVTEVAPASAPEGDAAYLRALEAWRRGDSLEALRLAREAQTLAGRHDPAALLEAYALIRVRQRAKALAILSGLAEGPTAAERPEVRKAANKLWHRFIDRQDRSHPSMFFGAQLAGRYTGAALAPGFGYTLGVDYPLSDLFGLAGEFSAYDTSDGTPLVEGPVLDVLASASVPIGTGSWALRIKAGPSIWLAGGALYGDTLSPTVGTRAVLGLDARPWPIAGFFIDGGAWAWPGLARSLPAWMFAWDLRSGVIFWIPPAR